MYEVCTSSPLCGYLTKPFLQKIDPSHYQTLFVTYWLTKIVCAELLKLNEPVLEFFFFQLQKALAEQIQKLLQ